MDERGLLHAAVAEHRAGRAGRAAVRYRALLAWTPSNAQALHLLGVSERQHGRPREAVRLIGTALRLDPALPGAAANLENAIHDLMVAAADLQGRGEHRAALALCALCLSHRPDSADALAIRAFCEYDLGRPAQALALARIAAALWPDRAGAHYNLATLAYRQARMDRAWPAFLRAHLLAGGGLEDAASLAALAIAGLPDLGQVRDAARTAVRRLPDLREHPTLAMLRAILDGDRDTLARRWAGWHTGSTHNHFSAAPLQTLCLRCSAEAAGGVPVRRPAGGRPRISVASLAHYGRFAHTVNNYVTARLYAERHGFDLETPEWQGHAYFDLDDAPASGTLPYVGQFEENGCVLWDAVSDPDAPPDGAALRDIDLFSPFADFYRPAYRDRVQAMMRVRPHWRERFGRHLDALRGRGRTVVALHVRLGDLEWGHNVAIYGANDDRLCREWLRRAWPELERPVLYIASDEPEKAMRAFADYAPVCLGDLTDAMPVVEHIQDFHVLMHADVVVTGRGSFATTAAALNRTARLVLRPDPGGGGLVPYDPWNATPRWLDSMARLAERWRRRPEAALNRGP